MMDVYRPDEESDGRMICPACFGAIEEQGHHPHVGTVYDCVECSTENLAPTWLAGKGNLRRVGSGRLRKIVYNDAFGDVPKGHEDVKKMRQTFAVDYFAVEVEGVDVDEWVSMLNCGVGIFSESDIRDNIESAERLLQKEANPKTTNWEIDEDIVDCLVDYSSFNKPGVEVHHGHVSAYIGHGTNFSFKSIPRSKYKKLASQVVERRPSMATDGNVTYKERLYQVAGSFHLIEEKIEHWADSADVSYLKWRKGKEKFQEMTGESYDEWIEEEIEEQGHQPWMSSNPGWSADE